MFNMEQLRRSLFKLKSNSSLRSIDEEQRAGEEKVNGSPIILLDEDDEDDEQDSIIGDDDHCKNLCHQAYLDCLQGIHDHIIEYLDVNIRPWQRVRRTLLKSKDSDMQNRLSCEYCSYEDWIRQCHPENTSQDDGYEIDFRFYLKDSEHRIIWNAYVNTYECPELEVSPDIPGCGLANHYYNYGGVKAGNMIPIGQ